ncbi:MAG TPA: hypothetical protein VHZ03_33695 [Trebonia sp.]|nr:hypothetical protein [Trebonia sp.]
MPPQSSAGPLPEPAAVTGQVARVSRRSVLRGAAGAGAVGLAAAGGVTAVAGLTRHDTPARQDAAGPAAALGGPVMVYLSDTSTGEMEVFAGTSQTSLRNPALVRELLRAIK